MQLLQLSESTAAYRKMPFPCVDATDGYTPETGLTFSAGELKIAKNGATEANAAGSVTEGAGGVYYYEATAGELNTLGVITLRVVKSGVRGVAALAQVVPFDPYSATNLGLTNIDATTSSRLADADYENLDTMLDSASSIETGLTLRGALRLMAAALAGKSSGAGTSTEYYRAAVSDSKIRLTATISANNRTAITSDTDT